MLFIDLDNFKTINDTLGHDIGDLLLQQTAQRLESCVREGDTVARLGGDEFVVMLEDLSEQSIEAATQAQSVGEKILATLGQPCQLATHEYHSTPSIGAAMFSDHRQSQEELLRRSDIAQTDFVAQVQSLVQRHAINPRLLKLELTESMLLENIEDIITTMNVLKKIGIRFSLDDFGTGYSSLQYLKRLPLDQLKIDQSFIRDIVINSSDRAIVRTVISMARSLKLDVIAEGVETEEQRQLLLHNGCTHYQGYLFSKPVPIEQFKALLQQG